MFQIDFVQNKSVATVKHTMIIIMEAKLEKRLFKQIKTNMNHKQFPPKENNKIKTYPSVALSLLKVKHCTYLSIHD